MKTKEEKAEYNRQWRLLHPGYQAAKAKQWAIDNAEHRAKYEKEWRAKNKDKVAARNAKWREAQKITKVSLDSGEVSANVQSK